MERLSAAAIKTSIFEPGQDLSDFVSRFISPQKNQLGFCIAITSKIVSLAENRILQKTEISKKDLVMRESDVYIGEASYGCHLTIKHNLLIPSAGIDESNSKNDEYILYPKDPYLSAKNLHMSLSQKWGIKHWGLILTDSHTTPLRKGVSGVALAYWGFKGVKNQIGKPDLFNRPLRMTMINIADSLASAAVLVMGESSECSPLAILDYPGLEFCETTDPEEIRIDPKDDLYLPLLL